MKHLTLSDLPGIIIDMLVVVAFIHVFSGCSTFQPLKECRAMCQGNVEVYQSDSEKCVCKVQHE